MELSPLSSKALDYCRNKFHVPRDYVHLKLLRNNFRWNFARTSEDPLHIQRAAGRTSLRCKPFTSQSQLQGIRKLCEHFLQELYKGKECLQRVGSQWTMREKRSRAQNSDHGNRWVRWVEERSLQGFQATTSIRRKLLYTSDCIPNNHL
jgi:hypothetical protein